MTIAPPATNLVFERTDELSTACHEQVVFCRDEATGLRAIIAIHDTRLGPALGGTRFFPYSSEAQALTDVLRLSQGMTHKAAVAGLPLGGGKAVIIGDPATQKTPDLLRAYGRFVDSLSGRYFTAADVGTTAEDLDLVRSQTRYVVGSNAGTGDSGFSTAYGVFCAMRSAADVIWGDGGLAGRTVGVEGVGKVGSHLVGMLRSAGARVCVCDPSARSIARLSSSHPDVTVREEMLSAPIDVYAPCALGATLTASSTASLQARLVCGAANNQLLDSSVASLLHQQGITWVPDFVANAGGLIQVGGESWGRTAKEVSEQITGIEDTVREILTISRTDDRPTLDVATEMARARLSAAP